MRDETHDAILRERRLIAFAFGGSGVRVAEGTALEMRCVGNCTEGSNPSRSDSEPGAEATG